MKNTIIVLSLAFLFACAPISKPPKVTWYIDPVKIPWKQYVLDHEICQNCADIVFPIRRNRVRKQPYLAYNFKLKQTYYLDCMKEKGHTIYCIVED